MKIYRLCIVAFLLLISSSMIVFPSNGEIARYAGVLNTLNYKVAVESIDLSAIEQHIRYLSSIESRLSGYPGCDRAAKHIFSKFQEYGLSDVQFQNFSVTVPVDYGASLHLASSSGNRSFKLYPLWPNLVATVSLKDEGITGPLIYVGDGALSDLNYKKVEGSIALMEFNSGSRWLNLVAHGAKAVIFIAPQFTVADEAGTKVISQPISFPRFWISHDDAAYLRQLIEKEPVYVRVSSSMEWELRETRNVLGFINGTKYPDKIIVLSSHYDSFSIVPSLAPGAEEAVGIAVLMELAKFFKDHPPAYTIMFAALSGHHQGYLGANALVREYILNKKCSPISKEWYDRVILMLNIDLNTESKSVGTTIFGAYLQYIGWIEDDVKPLQSFITGELRQSIEQALGKKLDVLSYEGGLQAEWGMLYQYMVPLHIFPFDGQVFRLAGGPSLNIMTSFAIRKFKDLPLDTFDKVDIRNLKDQLEFIYPCLYALANLDLEIMNDAYLYMFKDWRGEGTYTTLKGTVVEYRVEKAWYNPVPNALVAVCQFYGYTNFPYIMWWDGVVYTFADENGNFEVPGLTPETGPGNIEQPDVIILPFVINSTGSILYAPDKGQHAFSTATIGLHIGRRFFDAGYVVTFECGNVVFFDFYDPELVTMPLDGSTDLGVYEFTTHSLPESFYVMTNKDPRRGFTLSVAFIQPERPAEFLIKTSYAQNYPLASFINASRENPEGTGYKVKKGEQLFITNTALHAAEQLYWINDYRMREISKSQVRIPNALINHNSTCVLIQNAYKALDKHLYDVSYQYSVLAWIKELRAYRQIRSAAEDSVLSLPFIAALLVPFSFLAEKLFFSSKGMKRLLLTVILACGFVSVLSIFHPGFYIANNVILLFIGFVLLVLVIPAIVFQFNVIKETVRWVRSITIGRPSAEMGAGAAFLLAYQIGCEHIRKRKLRSALTFISITMTVIALSLFTSVTALSAPKAIPVEGTPMYEGIMIKPLHWGETKVGIGERIVEIIRARYGSEAIIVPRAWLYSQGSKQFPMIRIIGPSGTKAYILAILGLTPEEAEVTQIDKALTSGRWFISQDRLTCIISEDLAQRLGIEKSGANINLLGLNFTVIGIINGEILESLNDLNGEPLTPIMLIPYAGWDVHATDETVLIVPYEDVLSLSGMVMSVAVKFENTTLLNEATDWAFNTFNRPVYMAADGEIKMYSRQYSITFFGWESQIVPLAIILFSILNIMMGSVYSRRREIFTLSTTGLSPLHISGIFLAESTIYAIVGALTGYLIANAIGTIGNYIMPGMIYLNFSSSRVVMSLGGAMAVTILSSLYPLIVVSKMVTPSLERVWKIPTKPKGGKWMIPLPFQVGDEKELRGVIAYIWEYLSLHSSDVSPTFSARNIRYEERADYHVISANLRMEPYEAGVSQEVQFIFTRDPVKDRYVIELDFNLITGERSLWLSLTGNFAYLIRKQLLLWRSLSIEERIKYEEKSTSPYLSRARV